MIVGELAGGRSPAAVHSPLVGADIRLDAGGVLDLPLRADFEHAVLVLSGAVVADGVDVTPGPLVYLGAARSVLTLGAAADSRVLLLGGEPFEERIVMWWNFVGRSHDEITASRADWVADRRFGAVDGWGGARLPAPPLPATPLRPRGRVR